jgi:hypothetical protein
MTITTTCRTTLTNNIVRSAREVQSIMETVANRDGVTRAGEQKRIDHLNTFRVACVRRLAEVKRGA